MMKMPKLISNAKSLVPVLDKQYKYDLADSGWIEYITKETAENTDNILWTAVK